MLTLEYKCQQKHFAMLTNENKCQHLRKWKNSLKVEILELRFGMLTFVFGCQQVLLRSFL